jgi:hypothetical protein
MKGMERIQKLKNKYMQEKKLFEGREYGDIVIVNLDSHFGFWDRIKILFGCTVYSHVEVYCKNEEVHPVGSTCKTNVARLFKWKSKRKGIMISPSQTDFTNA